MNTANKEPIVITAVAEMTGDVRCTAADPEFCADSRRFCGAIFAPCAVADDDDDWVT